MNSIIEIKDKNQQGALSVKLNNILSLIKDEVADLSWAILDLYTMGYVEENTKFLGYEKKLENTNDSILVTWDELHELSGSCIQIIDIIIGGSNRKNFQPVLSPEHPIEELYDSCQIVIELIDGDVWRIYSQRDNIIDKLRSTLLDGSKQADSETGAA